MREITGKNLLALIFLFLFIIPLIGCDLFGIYHSYSPPDWIIGTWKDVYELNCFVFETDNVILDSRNNGVYIDFTQTYQLSSVREESSNTLYRFTIKSSGRESVYSFEKTSETTLNYSLSTEEGDGSVIELVKE